MMSPLRGGVVLIGAMVACSSSDSNGPSLSRTQKVGALTDADLPAVCDAWATGVGGYGALAKTMDCGNATSTARPPTSQAECIAAFQQNMADASCTATVGDFLDCKAALYANPCATVGEAPTCTIFFTSTVCRTP
jgi:hypothetical protein